MGQVGLVHSRTTVLPRYSESRWERPYRSVRLKSGAGAPTVTAAGAAAAENAARADRSETRRRLDGFIGRPQPTPISRVRQSVLAVARPWPRGQHLKVTVREETQRLPTAAKVNLA